MSTFALDLQDPTTPRVVVDGVAVPVQDLTLTLDPERRIPKLVLVLEGVGGVLGVGEVQRAATPREDLLELLDRVNPQEVERLVAQAGNDFSVTFGEAVLRAVRELVSRA